MVVRKQSRHRGFRGHRTYHGAHRKWRGGGSRGGRGAAGGHKHKWSYVVKYDPEHFGKHGFAKPSKKIKAINLGDIDKLLGKIDSKSFEKSDGMLKIDLGKLGYDKVLGSGRLTKPVVLKARYFSKAVEGKVSKAGGRIEKI